MIWIQRKPVNNPIASGLWPNYPRFSHLEKHDCAHTNSSVRWSTAPLSGTSGPARVQIRVYPLHIVSPPPRPGPPAVRPLTASQAHPELSRSTTSSAQASTCRAPRALPCAPLGSRSSFALLCRWVRGSSEQLGGESKGPSTRRSRSKSPPRLALAAGPPLYHLLFSNLTEIHQLQDSGK